MASGSLTMIEAGSGAGLSAPAALRMVQRWRRPVRSERMTMPCSA